MTNSNAIARPTAVRSTARFIERVERMTRDASGFTLASLDFDHMGYFLKTYGSLRVERALEQCWRVLELRLQGLDATILRSSLDETEVALTGVDAATVAELLRANAGDAEAVGALLFGTRRPRFGFTAVISSVDSAGVTYAPPYSRLRHIAASNQRALETMKEASCRGDVRVGPFDYSNAGMPSVSDLWTRLAGSDAQSARETSLSFREFESQVAGSHGAGTLLLVTPRFDGPAFGVTTADGGGRTLLPDGSNAGKLGFLNRVFGEHLTPNLIVESVLDELVRRCPWPHDLTCAGSTLILRTDAVFERADDLSELADWCESSRARTNQVLGGDVEVSHVQVALLPVTATRLAIDLAHRVYKLPARLHHESRVFVHDCRETSLDALEGLSKRYETEAAEEMAAQAT